MLDSDVAMLYECKTKVVNQTRKRNVKRFPDDFCFQLTEEEYKTLRSQIVTSKVRFYKQESRGGRRYLPYVFTEQRNFNVISIIK